MNWCKLLTVRDACYILLKMSYIYKCILFDWNWLNCDYIGYIVHLLKFVLLEFHSTNMVATRLMINMSTYNNG